MHDHGHGEHTYTLEEAMALLRYHADHNAHHAEELHDLAHILSASGDAARAEKLQEASQLLQKASKLVRETIQ